MTAPVSDDDLLTDLNMKLLNAYKAEEEFWRQRSRQLWLTLGDSNTSYFHAVTKGRRAKNKLTVLENEEGAVHFEEEKIAEVISNYYSKLFTSIPSDGSGIVDKALVPCVTQQMNDMLTKVPSASEIKEALLLFTQIRHLVRMGSQRVFSSQIGKWLAQPLPERSRRSSSQGPCHNQ